MNIHWIARITGYTERINFITNQCAIVNCLNFVFSYIYINIYVFYKRTEFCRRDIQHHVVASLLDCPTPQRIDGNRICIKYMQQIKITNGRPPFFSKQITQNNCIVPKLLRFVCLFFVFFLIVCLFDARGHTVRVRNPS